MDDTPECYTRLPNSVLEWLYGPEHDLTMRQVRVLMVVFRIIRAVKKKPKSFLNSACNILISKLFAGC